MLGKLGCALALAVLFAAAAVTRAPFAVFLLVLALGMAGFLYWDARTLRRQVKASLQVPAKPVRPGQDFAVNIHLQNAGRRPVPELRVVLQAAETHTGTAVALPCGTLLEGNGQADLRVTLRAAKSGVWRLQLQQVTVRDHLGVFAMPCPVPAQSWELCVLPPEEGADDGTTGKPQTKAEQAGTAGSELADGVYDLRPYRRGDTIKQIHWKLTAKLDELTVREPLGTLYRVDPAGQTSAQTQGRRTLLQAGHAAVTKLRVLTRRKAADPATGLTFVDRKLTPRSPQPANKPLWAGVDLALLLALTLGLLAAAAGAFALALPWWVYAGAAALCCAWAALWDAPLRPTLRRGVLLAAAIGYLVLLFAVQQDFLAGMAQFGSAVAAGLNARFGANLAVAATAVPAQLGPFVLLAAVPVTGFFSAVTLCRADALLLDLVLLPAVAFVLLAGQGGNAFGWLLLLVGWVGAWAAARPVRRKNLWGGKNTPAYAANLQCFTNVQKTAAAGMMLLCGLLFVPAALLRPVAALPLNALQPVSDKAQAAVLSAAIEWLPKISNGAINFHVSTAAGGVEDGSLTQSDGLALQGLEDLMLTASAQPTETIYLRGFIGANYTGQSWQPADADSFDSAAANWKTDGDGRLAVLNLPFLRAAYGGAEPQQLTVQRIHANEAYTYAPYNAYFNDWYTAAGDGAVAGQTAQDDVFYYFPRKQAKELLAARADSDPSVLDRLESAYAAYVQGHYLTVPTGADYDALQEACTAQKLDASDVDGIRTFVRSYLNERCTYDSAAQTPQGTDPVLYFLNSSKTGGSPQFASAAVVLCRMLGLPARYVVGYAAPQTLFTVQSDGSYRAVLQDDNAHAWAEVYVAGQGWTPLEVTPGVVGELAENELQADTAEAIAADDDPDMPPAPAQQPADTQAAPGGKSLVWLAAAAVVVLLAGVVVLVLRARRTPKQKIQAAFAALWRKMRRCGLPEAVSSDEAAFAEFLVTHCKGTTPETVNDLLGRVQAASFSAAPCTRQDAQKVLDICRILRRKMRKTPTLQKVAQQNALTQ